MSYDELMKKYIEITNKYIETETKYNEAEAKYNEAQLEIENLKLELQNLKKVVFGTKREYTPVTEEIENGEQTSLFDDSVQTDEEIEEQVAKNVEEITVHQKKKNKKKKAGIKRSNIKNTEIEVEHIELPVDENGSIIEKCPVCGCELEEIGKKVVRTEIEYIPAKLKIKEYVEHRYKCKECGTDKSENENSIFVKAPVPKPLLTHSFVSPSLATEVIYQKYYSGMPLYRQEKMWEDQGLVLPRNMMANWIIKICEYYLEPLWELMMKQLKEQCQVLHADETGMQVNKEPGRNAANKSYMWLMASGNLEAIKGVVFKYAASRSAKTAQEFLKGFKGILVTDGYSAYNDLEISVHAECWAHVRRKFLESIPLTNNRQFDTSSYGYTGLLYCDKLFKIEREIADFDVDKKVQERQNRSKPVLEAFFKWVHETLEKKIILNDKLKKGLTYASNQEKELSQFLNDGRIPLSNNLVERRR